MIEKEVDSGVALQREAILLKCLLLESATQVSSLLLSYLNTSCDLLGSARALFGHGWRASAPQFQLLHVREKLQWWAQTTAFYDLKKHRVGQGSMLNSYISTYVNVSDCHFGSEP